MGETVRRSVLVAAFLLLISACGGKAETPVASPSATSVEAVRDCGTFILDQGEQIDPRAYQCLVDAVAASRSARLVITRPTIEGDPVPVTYVADTGGTVEMTTDTSQDNLGGSGGDDDIQTQTCTGPSVVKDRLKFANCS